MSIYLSPAPAPPPPPAPRLPADAPPVRLPQTAQVTRRIRPKGVGVHIASQKPADIP
ncbi:helicase HerA-like domain-containing protein, partial [Erwinia amylovora]|uniref:helicase HerA-like domain-containing protein n=1 Tax=Erwinia amylovora TaxID=552 RepID=UPI0038559A30